MENLKQANNQWANRPADERFWDLPELIAARKASAQSSVEKLVPTASLYVTELDGGIALHGGAGNPALLTHFAFGQLCQDIGAPAGYLRQLPARLATECLREGLSSDRRVTANDASLLLQQNGKLYLRAITSDKYARIWDWQIAEALANNLPVGWRVPPARPAGATAERTRPATELDVLRLQIPGLSINVGDTISPAGLYAGDRDMFIFMVNEENAIVDNGTVLGRGFFLWNSEVGSRSFGISTFLYDAVCGNHIVWGARNIKEVTLRHIGSANDRAFLSLRMDLVEYANSSVGADAARIKIARSFMFGSTKQEAVGALISMIASKRIQLTQGQLNSAYDIALESSRYGAPGSLWGMVNGLTELSQRSEYADKRVTIDRAAGKLLEVAF